MIVTSQQVAKAIDLHGQRHRVANPDADPLVLCPPASRLCDLLGAMWWEHESSASIPDKSDVAELMVEVLPELCPSAAA